MTRFLKQHTSLVWIALVVLAALGSLMVVRAQRSSADAAPAAAPPPPTAPTKHSVTIKPGPSTPQMDTGLKDARGQAITAACSSCHSTTTPNTTRNTASDLFQAHRGLNYDHGSLTCLSCHNSKDYDTLHLADGRSLPFPDVMTLCAQCHGTAMRDYQHGSHGGMNGYWNLAQGPRVRNNCVNCHDPHHPHFPILRPVLPPRDRISVPFGPDMEH